MTNSNATELDKIFGKYETGIWKLGRTLDDPKSGMSCGEYDAERMKLIEECAQAVAVTLGAEKPCYATDYTHEHCKYSVNRGWTEDATLGAGECEWIYPQGALGWLGRFKCSACGHAFSDCDESEWNYCPNCGKAVKR